jgi:hypothetical protein
MDCEPSSTFCYRGCEYCGDCNDCNEPDVDGRFDGVDADVAEDTDAAEYVEEDFRMEE